jgi:hypothetical protein
LACFWLVGLCQAKEAELEAERQALIKRQHEEKKFAKENEAVQVGHGRHG